MLLQDYATRSARARPDATALVMGGARVSYDELERTSNRLARLLVGVGCGPGERVALCTEKSPEAVIAMLAVLKTGGAYVPIDTDSPAPRAARILSAAEPRVVLASAAATGMLDALTGEGALGDGVTVGALGRSEIAGDSVRGSFSLAACDDQPDGPLDPVADGDSIAHLLFTSGSTGVPKGVAIAHRNATAFVDWAVSHYGTRAEDRISGHPPLHFDLSTFDIYATFAAGAELHLVPAQTSLIPRVLAAFIRESELTQWFSVPSVLTFLAKFEVVEHRDFPALERLLWCGEVLPTPVLRHWMDRLPHVRFSNLYGPTEATIASSYFDVPERPADETEPIPIGTPCAGEELLVLDDDLNETPAGEIGQLFITGVGLSPGYWHDEQQTRAAFLPDPRRPESGDHIYRTGDLARRSDDGLFHFLGRVDSQIKSRGYRIELGEIETAVNAVDEIRESAIIGVETGGFEGTTICCAYSVRPGRELEAPQLRERLTAVLPKYMLPSRWAVLDGLPTNVNGKIDRPALRALFERKAPEAETAA